MAEFSWGDIKPYTKKAGTTTKTGGSSELFMKLDEGTHIIRLAGKAKPVYTMWTKDKKKFLVPENYVQRLESLDIKVNLKYAVNVIDRADTRKGITRFKILERPESMFAYFRNYYETMKDANGKNIDPGGVNGPDWSITVTIPLDKEGKKEARNTKYVIMPMMNTPFSAEEKELIKRGKEPDKYKELPLGERGLIDLNRFYNEEKAAKPLEDFLSESTGMKSSEAESIDDVVGAKESDGSMDDLLASEPEKTSETKEPAKVAAASTEDDEGILEMMKDIGF